MLLPKNEQTNSTLLLVDLFLFVFWKKVKSNNKSKSAVQGQIMRRSVPEEPIGEMDCSTSSHSKIINIMKYV